MTKLEKCTKQAIIAWCNKNHYKPIKLSHIYTRAYIIARPAHCCIIVARPPVDAKPQIKKLQSKLSEDNTEMCHVFDKSLKAGDWCSMAYVSTANSGEPVAIKAVEA